jgi:hypothetical protein
MYCGEMKLSRIRLLLLLILVLIPIVWTASVSPISARSKRSIGTSFQDTQLNLSPRGGGQQSNSALTNGIKNFLASGLAAACSKTILAPFDTIKTMQQQSMNGGKALSVLGAARVVMSRPKGFIELYVRSK